MFDPDDLARMTLERMESYCAAHPDSPSALHRPSLSLRNGLWIALLGHTMGEGIVGIGYSVDAALHAFDRQWSAYGLASVRRVQESSMTHVTDHQPFANDRRS